MPLFTDLSVGVSGLKASQYALNAVAHNLSNLETEGYVRQQTLLDSSTYLNIGQNAISFKQIGLGVDTADVRQVRDRFLDQTYRLEVGRQGFYDSQADAVAEVENLFGELQGVAFQDSMEEFWVSLQEMSKEPDSRVAQATLVETAITFMERADSIYKQLKTYQLDLNTQISNQIKRVNEIGDQLVKLNQKVSQYEAGGIENANDYRDQRNLLLDELGQIVKISYKEQANKRISVDIEGVRFVSDDACFHMESLTMSEYTQRQGIESQLDEASGILVPIWPHLNDAEVFDWSTLPNAEANSDVGGLKGALAARGTGIGKYTSIPIEPKASDYMDEDGVLDEEAYKQALDKFETDTEKYNLSIESSIMMMTEAQFDQLIHGIVTTVNDALCPDKEVRISAGTTVTLNDGTDYTFEEDSIIRIFDEENAPVGVDKDATPGTELFSRKTEQRYLEAQDITLADGSVIEDARIYNWERVSDNYSLYTLGEIEVNQEIVANKSKLPVISNDGTGDYDISMIEKLLTKWQEPFATLSPNTLTYNNFNAYYTQFTGAIATRGDEYNTLAKNQAGMVKGVDDKRTAITGVASDDELAYLIKYQHAYNASSRYITVVSEMLEHIIMRM